MQNLKQLLTFTLSPCFVLLFLLPLAGCISQEELNQSSRHKTISNKTHKEINPVMIFDITLHGLLLWASLGFLMPVGILIIRMSNRQEGQTRVKVLFYIHVILQILSVLLATAGAVFSLKNLENSFNNHHQRIGLALYGAIWAHALIGFCRPNRVSKGRRMWYFVHWVLGTTISLVGIINIYTGLKAYHKKTSRSIRLWTILFTAEITFIAFFYLFQDKWEYVKKQGVILGNEPITPFVQMTIPQSNKQKMLREPCKKSNALINYFN